MEYYARVCMLSVVFTSRCVRKFCYLARPSVSRDIKFYYIPSSEILEFPSVINFDIITSDDIDF